MKNENGEVILTDDQWVRLKELRNSILFAICTAENVKDGTRTGSMWGDIDNFAQGIARHLEHIHNELGKILEETR